jgi:hypothetical protein
MGNLRGEQERRAERAATTEAVDSSPGTSTWVAHAVQASAGPAAPVEMTGGEPEVVHAIADTGIEGSGGALPFGQRLQSLFRAHDVSGVRVHTDKAAMAAPVSRPPR